MSNISISSGSSQHSTTEWDTGFPDSFAYNTTSRRHPDAKLGEFAVIQAADLDPQYAMNHRKHLLLKKHRRTISHGKVTPLETIFSSEAEYETGLDGEIGHESQIDEQPESALAQLERPTSSSTSSTGDRGKRKGLFRWRGH